MALVTTVRNRGKRLSVKEEHEDDGEGGSPDGEEIESKALPDRASSFQSIIQKQLSKLQQFLEDQHELEVGSLRKDNCWLRDENARLDHDLQMADAANFLRACEDLRAGTDCLRSAGCAVSGKKSPKRSLTTPLHDLSHAKHDPNKNWCDGPDHHSLNGKHEEKIQLKTQCSKVATRGATRGDLGQQPARKTNFSVSVRNTYMSISKQGSFLPTTNRGSLADTHRASMGSTIMEGIHNGQIARQLGEKSGCALHPAGLFLPHWDKVVMVVLGYTAIVSPVEICFFNQSCGMSWTFMANQLVNIVFLVDLVLQFFIMVETKSWEGIRFIRDRKVVARRYLRGWFTLDLLSVLPFDSVGCMMQSEELQKMKVARFVRLVRLLKLVRLMKASRILARWQVAIAFPYTWQTLCKFVVMLIMGAHWMGCLWGLIGLELLDYTWVDALADGKPYGMPMSRFPESERPSFSIYLASIHFSICSITSIGYGDIVPHQAAEYIVCTICQMSGGLLWAYGISEVIAVVSNLNPGATAFRRTMDDLNHMMSIKGLDQPMQVRLRSFFLQARELHDAERYHDLLSRMSPKLQGDVARVTNTRWIQRVWYLTPMVMSEHGTMEVFGITDQFIAQIAVALRAMVCSPEEVLRTDATLRVLTRGLAGQNGRVLRAGDVWGEDFILEHEPLRKPRVTTCLTFVEVQYVTRRSFMDVLRLHGTPQDIKLIRQATVKLAVIRGVVAQAKEKVKQRELNVREIKQSRMRGELLPAPTEALERAAMDGETKALPATDLPGSVDIS